MAPDQKQLLKDLPSGTPVYVEGAFRVWLQDSQVSIVGFSGGKGRYLYPNHFYRYLNSVHFIQAKIDSLPFLYTLHFLKKIKIESLIRIG